MNIFSENKNLYSTIFTALKNMGVKVPKIKNIKSSMPKHDKSTLQLDTQIFGVSLFKQEWTHASDNPLPKFLAMSIAYLAKFSTTVGLFRKSGSIARQRSLRIKIKNGESLEGSDPNDVASLLKQWLRELPEPLIPYCMHELFVRCQHLDSENRVTAALLSCLLLPPEHFYSLKHLLCFLKNFATHSSDNKMGVDNLALVMAPNIFTSKAESKPCNISVQLHTSVIELLIQNADSIGEVPQSVSLYYSNLDGRRNLELESSAEILDSGPLKLSRKLRTGPVQDLFSGIRKLVGQNPIPTPNSKILTPETSWASPHITCRPVLRNNPEETLSTLKDEDKTNKDMHVLGIKTKQNRIRRKSFGLLRRKDKKRQKSNRTSSLTKRDLAISRSSNFNSEIATDRMNTTYKVLTSSILSEKKLPAVQFECDESNYESVKVCSSENNSATSSKELFNISTTKSSLNCPQDDPYVSLFWSQSNKKVKSEQLETWQSECLYADVESNINKSKALSESRDLAVKPDNFSGSILSYPNHNSISDSSYDQRHSSNNIISLTDNSPINPQIQNYSEISLSKVNCTESKTKLQKLNNEKKEDPKTNANLYQTNLKKDINNTWKSKQTTQNSVIISNPSKKENSEAENNIHYSTKIRQEACVVKSKNKEKNSAHQMKGIDSSYKNNGSSVDLHRSKSFFVDSNFKSESKGKSNSSAKTTKKTTRQSSLIRGKPNSIKSGLPCHHLDKSPILKQSLEIKNEKTISQNESNPNTHISENGRFFSEADISLILNFAGLNLSPKSPNHTSDKNSESFATSVPKISPTTDKDASYALTLNKEPLPLPSCHKNAPYHSDSRIPKLKHTNSLSTNPKCLSEISTGNQIQTPKLKSSGSVRSIGHSRIPVLSKKLHLSDLDSSLNDSCFLTPNKTLFYSPNSITWMSGSRYLSIHSPQEDSYNKRESIALILKNKSGHVLEKVQLYDSQGSPSCSTPVIAKNSNERVSPMPKSLFRSSEKQLPGIQNNRKALSVSQSCDTNIKRTNLRSRKRISLKLSHQSSKSSIKSEALSPNTTHSLKEVTNLNFEGKQIPSYNSTPVKEDDYALKSTTTNKPKIYNTDSSKSKLKRNSFSGQTPSRFSKKVSRSESSPSCPRPGSRLFKLIKESTFNNSNLPLDKNNVHNSSFSPAHSFSHQHIKKSESSLSIQKLKSDEMIDEWQCEF